MNRLGEVSAEKKGGRPMPQTESPEHLLSPEELALYLGIGRTNAYALLARGEIPSLRLGKLRRVRKRDVDVFIEERLMQAEVSA